MTTSRLVSALTFVTCVAMATGAAAQSPFVELGRTGGKIDGGAIGTGGRNGSYSFYWETRLEPVFPAIGNLASDAWRDTEGGAGDPNVVHRLLFDRERRVYFGYDVRMEPLPLPERSSRLSFRPLTMTPRKAERVLGADAAAWTIIPAPPFPAPRLIAHGEVLEVPLLTNQAWGQRLVEYVTIHDNRLEGFAGLEVAPREFVNAPGTPRDFTIEDVQLRLSRPTVTERTRTAGGGSSRHRELPGDFTGSVLWIYVPNRGRYLLSLQPRADLGFRKAGVVRGTTMNFSDGGTTYTLGSAARIAPGQSAFNLYVLFQKDWKPTYEHANLDTFHFGAVERVEELLGK